MRILVTGGSGFIGSAFTRLALDCGHTVAVLSRAGQPPDFSSIKWLHGSLTEAPWQGIAEFQPEVCVHAAWIATPGVYLESEENHQWLAWSRAFLLRLCDMGLRHIVSLGTCIEYQITGAKLREDVTPVVPSSTYASCKHELHRQLCSMLPEKGVSLAWARLFYPYGEGEHPARLPSSLINALEAGRSVTLNTPRSVKDYIHIDDVASALLMLVQQKFDGAVNIGAGEGVQVETIARCLADYLQRPDLVLVPNSPVADPLDFVVADSTRLRSLQWRPQVTLKAGLRRLVEAHRA